MKLSEQIFLSFLLHAFVPDCSATVGLFEKFNKDMKKLQKSNINGLMKFMGVKENSVQEKPSYKPKPSYGAPKPSYNPPKPSYKPPKPSYNPPKSSYYPPKPSYNPPKPSYNPPKPSYQNPTPSYDVPASSYSAPSSSYNSPTIFQTTPTHSSHQTQVSQQNPSPPGHHSSHGAQPQLMNQLQHPTLNGGAPPPFPSQLPPLHAQHQSGVSTAALHAQSQGLIPPPPLTSQATVFKAPSSVLPTTTSVTFSTSASPQVHSSSHSAMEDSVTNAEILTLLHEVHDTIQLIMDHRGVSDQDTYSEPIGPASDSYSGAVIPASDSYSRPAPDSYGSPLQSPLPVYNGGGLPDYRGSDKMKDVIAS